MKPKAWFKSTLGVLIAVLVLSSAYGVYLYGFEEVMDAILKYIIGASATAIVLLIAGNFWVGKQINT